MNQYPTIFVSFRQVDGLNFTGAYDMLTMVIADLYNEHLYLLDSKNATEFQKTAFAHIVFCRGVWVEEEISAPKRRIRDVHI